MLDRSEAAQTLQCAARCWIARGEALERAFAREFGPGPTGPDATAPPAAQGSTRQLAPSSVLALLDELKREPDVATICAFNDFAYKGRDETPKVEREYWLKLSGTKLLAGGLSGKKLAGVTGADGLIIMHVHYAGDHPCPADPRRPKIDIAHRSTCATLGRAAGQSSPRHARTLAVVFTDNSEKVLGLRFWFMMLGGTGRSRVRNARHLRGQTAESSDRSPWSRLLAYTIC